jgi:Uma2 family endonuclease
MEQRDAMRDAPRSGVKLTYDDLLAMVPEDDGLGHELIDGEHFVTASPNTRHQRLAGRLHLALATHLGRFPEQGEVFIARLDVIFSPYDVVEPDLLVVTGDQQEIVTEKNVQGAPAIVIEILSPSTRTMDEQRKRQLFERSEVREYWMVDPDADAVTMYRRSTDRSFPQVSRLTAGSGDTLASPLLRNFELSLVELFR